MTDGQGNKVKFNNTIVILTSNLGSADMYRESELGFTAKTPKDKKALEQEYEENKSYAMKALKKVMTEARKSLERFFGKSIYLETFVKVDKDWRNSDRELNLFGYNPDR